MNKQWSPQRLFYHPLIVAICLLLTGLLIYADTFSAPFVFDDYGIIVDNPQTRISRFTPTTIMALCRPPGFYRPLAKLTFAVNHVIQGLDVFGYHLVNVLIHIITAWLVFYMARETLRQCGWENNRAAFFSAMIWLVSPVHTQSVTYIAQRMNGLAAMFYLLSLICYIRARQLQIRDGRRKLIYIWFSGCCLAGLFGLASKQIVATLPVFILVYEWFFFQNLDRNWLKKHLPGLGLAMALCCLIAVFYLGGHPLERISSDYEGKPFTLIQRLFTQPGVVLYYLSLLAWPHPARLILDYDFPLSNGLTDPISTALSLAAVAMLATLATFTVRKHRLLSFAIFWFLGNLVIESSVIGLALAFEHRAYLPSVFLIIAISTLLLRHITPPPLAIGILGLFIVCGGIWTYQRNITWQDKSTLWQDCVNKAPANARACHNLGLALERDGDYPRAIRSFRKSLDLATRRLGDGHPEIANICNNLGNVLLKAKAYQEAGNYFQLALRQQETASGPDFLNTAGIYNNLGKAAQHLGDTAGAIEYYKQALAVSIKAAGPGHPDTAEIYNNLGVAYETMGDLPLAESCYRRALIVFRDRFGDDHPATRTVMNNLSALRPLIDTKQ